MNDHARTFVEPRAAGLAQVWGAPGEVADRGEISRRIVADIELLGNWRALLAINVLRQTAARIL